MEMTDKGLNMSMMYVRREQIKRLRKILIESAHMARICIVCKEPKHLHIRTKEGQEHYSITGICEDCWDKEDLALKR